MGLRSIINKIMPGASTLLFSSVDELMKKDEGQFYHYFVSAQVLMDNSNYFVNRQNKTIVLLHGNDCLHLPKQFHTFNVCLSEDLLVRSFLKVSEKAHSVKHPEIVDIAKGVKHDTKLTRREREVLRLIVLGKKNREVAEELNVGLATVITHRKNLIAKLNIKRVSGLTVYAVTHGVVRAEEI